MEQGWNGRIECVQTDETENTLFPDSTHFLPIPKSSLVPIFLPIQTPSSVFQYSCSRFTPGTIISLSLSANISSQAVILHHSMALSLSLLRPILPGSFRESESERTLQYNSMQYTVVSNE